MRTIVGRSMIGQANTYSDEYRTQKSEAPRRLDEGHLLQEGHDGVHLRFRISDGVSRVIKKVLPSDIGRGRQVSQGERSRLPAGPVKDLALL